MNFLVSHVLDQLSKNIKEIRGQDLPNGIFIGTRNLISNLNPIGGYGKAGYSLKHAALTFGGYVY